MKELNKGDLNIYASFLKRVFSYIVFLLMVLNIHGCHEEQKSSNNIKVFKSKPTEDFIVSMGIIANEPDIIDLFYATDYSLEEKFTEAKKLRRKIKGNNEEEQVEFVLKGIKVLKFRLDLGRNMDQEGIIIRFIRIRSGEKTLLIKGNLVKYFFNENEYMHFLEQGEIHFDPAPRKTPFMTSSALLTQKMKIEF